MQTITNVNPLDFATHLLNQEYQKVLRNTRFKNLYKDLPFDKFNHNHPEHFYWDKINTRLGLNKETFGSAFVDPKDMGKGFLSSKNYISTLPKYINSEVMTLLMDYLWLRQTEIQLKHVDTLPWFWLNSYDTYYRVFQRAGFYQLMVMEYAEEIKLEPVIYSIVFDVDLLHQLYWYLEEYTTYLIEMIYPLSGDRIQNYNIEFCNFIGNLEPDNAFFYLPKMQDMGTDKYPKVPIMIPIQFVAFFIELYTAIMYITLDSKGIIKLKSKENNDQEKGRGCKAFRLMESGNNIITIWDKNDGQRNQIITQLINHSYFKDIMFNNMIDAFNGK